ncbi:MAG: PQQ-dependent sugar dehydrogenase, partial [Nitrospirota bacterium]
MPRFGPDGKLYVTIGETNHHDLAQDLGSLGGESLRLNPDGSISSDNPSGKSKIYAMGLRNSFGMVFHPQTGDLWVKENGPDCNDEVNRIVKGGTIGDPLSRDGQQCKVPRSYRGLHVDARPHRARHHSATCGVSVGLS